MLNGPGHLDERRRYVGNMNLSFAYVEGESLIMGLKARACWAADCGLSFWPAVPACDLAVECERTAVLSPYPVHPRTWQVSPFAWRACERTTQHGARQCDAPLTLRGCGRTWR